MLFGHNFQREPLLFDILNPTTRTETEYVVVITVQAFQLSD